MPPEMVPSHCPYCGGGLTEKMNEGRERLYCNSCERFIWRNPSPVAALIIRDREGKVLLVKRGIEPGKGKWSLPAGFLELEENARQAAVRELGEETGLKADSGDLAFVRDMNFERFPEQSLLANIFQVEASKTSGEVKPGSDAVDAKFWDLEELEADDSEELHRNFLPAFKDVKEIDF
jgi:8-oxo-dGTP diphosphatase